MSEPLTKEEQKVAQRWCDDAPPGPWYVVEQPWRSSYYDKELGLHRPLTTYVIAGSADPHIGMPVLDGFDIDDWEDEADYDAQVARSDAALYFTAHARTNLPRALATIEARDAEIDDLKKRLAEMKAERDVLDDTLRAADEYNAEHGLPRRQSQPAEPEKAQPHGSVVNTIDEQ